MLTTSAVLSSLAFVPFWEECITTKDMSNAEDAMDRFDKLFSSCSHLDSPERIKLMGVAGGYVDNPKCDIDTSLIMSTTAANAPCATDATDLCPEAVSSGQQSCHEDYCDTCPQKHVCDHTCNFPCLSEEASPPPPVEVEICEVDSIDFCDHATTSGLYTCETDFCLSCPQAHSCDKSCGLPCSKGDGTGVRYGAFQLRSTVRSHLPRS
jgi:hypothetical protein